jgi:hypothetical protein
MRHNGLPEKFTRIGFDEDGREYIQCTRTGDVLVQTGAEEWSHFASAREWRRKTAAQLYPELIYLQRALKRVGSHEEVEEQIRVLREALSLAEGLRATIEERIEVLGAGAERRPTLTV